MNVLIYDTEEQIGIAAGNYMCGQVLAKPNSVLGLATGSTPLKPYNHMIRLYEQGAVDFSKVTTFNLDEYCKLDVEDKIPTTPLCTKICLTTSISRRSAFTFWTATQRT